MIIAGFGLAGFVDPVLIPYSRTGLFVFLISSSVLVGIKSGILAGIFSTLVIFGFELFASGITNLPTGFTIRIGGKIHYVCIRRINHHRNDGDVF